MYMNITVAIPIIIYLNPQPRTQGIRFLLTGWSVLGKTLHKVLSTGPGCRPRAVFTTRPANNMFIFVYIVLL